MILKMRKLSGATENLIIPWQTTSSFGDFDDEAEDDGNCFVISQFALVYDDSGEKHKTTHPTLWRQWWRTWSRPGNVR